MAGRRGENSREHKRPSGPRASAPSRQATRILETRPRREAARLVSADDAALADSQEYVASGMSGLVPAVGSVG